MASLRMKPLEARITALARMPATAVSLRDLYRFGSRPNTERRLQNALFLQHELPIRMSQRIVELRSLPFGLSNSEQVRSVIDWYSTYVDQLTSFPIPKTDDDERSFTELLSSNIQGNSTVPTMLSLAVRAASQRESEAGSSRARSPTEHARNALRHSMAQSVLDRFFTARIGLRFLMEHHLHSQEEYSQQGWAGIIKENFCPSEVIQAAIDDATQLCVDDLGDAPPVRVKLPAGGATLTHVPSHIHYILTELLKNAMRAVTSRHLATGTLPDIAVTVAFGADDTCIRISDEGGGIPMDAMDQIWNYAYTTAPTPLAVMLDDREYPPQQLRQSALAGYGMGLPLSRLYAQVSGEWRAGGGRRVLEW